MTSALILPFHDKAPQIDASAFLAPGAVILGDVVIGAESSVWFGCVIRGDVNWIRIGRRTNIQDGTVCHVTPGDFPLLLGNDVTVGHGVVLHGCRIGDRTLVGIGARVLDGAVIGSESLIAAGSVVREGTTVGNGQLWAGVPAVRKRELTTEEIAQIRLSADFYVHYSPQYREMLREETYRIPHGREGKDLL